MSKFAKELGFFMISIFLISIPFFTGLRLGMVGELEWFTLLGVFISLIEVGCLTASYIGEYE